MFTYEKFISELRPLIVRGQTLYDRPDRTKDSDFRRWKLEVTDLIVRIQREKYTVNCSIELRSFTSFGGSYTGSDNQAIVSYNLDLKDTINELEILIERYDKHGAPNPITPSSSAAPSNELQPPKRMTLDWIWRHMPVTWWKYIVGVPLTVFGIAFTLGVKLGPLLK
jgi:hypothetical protein